MSIFTDSDNSLAEIGNVHSSTTAIVSLTPFHEALIKYATTSSRLLFIQDASVFTEFQSSDKTLSELTTLELCSIFLNAVLPNLQLFQLTATIENRFKLLDLHPCFRKTQHGYQYVQNIDARFILEPKHDFNPGELLPELLLTQLSPAKEEISPTGLTRRGGVSHTMLVDQDTVPHSAPKLQLSLDIATLLSAMLSTDLELPSAQLHGQSEIRSRLRNAKQSFEDAGNMLPYRREYVLITDNINNFEKLKKNLCKTFSSI